MKKIIVSIACLCIVHALVAQSPDIDTVKAELYKINKVFDSTIYLGFDVNIVYATDTVYGRFEHEEMSGRYILNKSNVYYKMGMIEYAQNDSFVYNIYHEDKTMVMTKGGVSGNSSLFPLRQFVDSIVAVYDSAYTITIRTEGDLKVIEFVAAVSNLPYKRFAIYYDSASHYPDKFEMSFNETLNDLPDVPDDIAVKIKAKVVTKKVSMSFSNYYSPQTLEVFDDASYVNFDRIRKRYMPNDKFRGYRFMASGISGEDDYDDSVEMSEPPQDGN